jgi:hypothetical protein
MTEHLLGNEFDKPDRIAFQLQFVKRFIDDLGVSMNLRPPDEKQFGELIAKARKVQYVATLEGTLLQVWLRGGKAKPLLVGSKDLDSVRDNAKARGILQKLADTTKLITPQQIYKWQETHYDEQELAFFRGTISEMESEQRKLKARHDALAGYKFDNKDSETLRKELHTFTAKHSWEHYLNFVEDIDKATADQTIYDTYVNSGAKFPVNLDGAIKAPIDKAIKTSKVDWGPARKLVVKLIDAKFIPEMRKDELASAAKELKRLETAIPEKKKAFVKAGGKL